MKQKGQGLVEYLILVCLVAVSAIAVVKVVGVNIQEQYANIANALTNKGRKIPFTPTDPSTYRKKGMDDYMEHGR